MLYLTNTNNITLQYLQYSDKYFTITQTIPHRITTLFLKRYLLQCDKNARHHGGNSCGNSRCHCFENCSGNSAADDEMAKLGISAEASQDRSPLEPPSV